MRGVRKLSDILGELPSHLRNGMGTASSRVSPQQHGTSGKKMGGGKRSATTVAIDKDGCSGLGLPTIDVKNVGGGGGGVGEEGKMEKTKKESSSNYRSATFLETLRYADKWDYVLLVLGLVACIIAGVISPMQLYIFRGLTNTLMAAQHHYEAHNLDIDEFTSRMLAHCLHYFLLAVGVFTTMGVAFASFATLCQRQVYRIRKRFFEAVLQQDAAWFDANEVGTLTQKMSSIDRIKDGLSDKLCICIIASVTMVASVALALAMSWQLTLVSMCAAPFIVLSIYGSGRRITKALRSEMEAYAGAGAIAEEVLAGVRTVAAFCAQWAEAARYGERLHFAREKGVRKATAIAAFMGLYLLILFSTMGLAFWYGSTLVFRGEMSPGTVFAVFWASLLGSMRIGQAIPQLNVVIGAKLAAGEIFAIIDRPPAVGVVTAMASTSSSTSISSSSPSRSEEEGRRKCPGKRLESGIDRIRAGCSDKLCLCISSLTALLAGVSVGLSLSWRMAVVSLCPTPIVLLTLCAFARLTIRAASAEQKAYAGAGAIASELLAAIPTVAAFNGQADAAARYESRLRGACQRGLRSKPVGISLTLGIYYLVFFSSMGLSFWHGGNLALGGWMSPGSVFACFWACMHGATRLGMALPQWGVVVGARVAAAEIFAIIDRRSHHHRSPCNRSSLLHPGSGSLENALTSSAHRLPEEEEEKKKIALKNRKDDDCCRRLLLADGDVGKENGRAGSKPRWRKTLEKVDGRIDFRDVNFAYPTRSNVPVLRGASFSVGAGESVALVGQSGCGKSTIFSLLMRFYEFRHGSITLDGVPLQELGVRWLRNTFAIVQQEPVIFAASVEDNLRMGAPTSSNDDELADSTSPTPPPLTQKALVNACQMANAHEFICRLPHGYSTLIGEGGVRLSGGQKQRIAIARALLRNPRVLLLDEATSALDAESEHAVQQAIEQASSGRTTITIAHRLSTVRNADRILVFADGRVVESGSHEELMALDQEGEPHLRHSHHGYYRQLVMAQEAAAARRKGGEGELVFEEDEEGNDGGHTGGAGEDGLELENGGYHGNVNVAEDGMNVGEENCFKRSSFIAKTPSSEGTAAGGGEADKEASATEVASGPIARMSARLRRSMISVRSSTAGGGGALAGSDSVFELPPPEEDDDSIEPLVEKLEGEGAKPASLADILRFSRPEWTLGAVGLLFSLVRGTSWPLFAVIYGRIFLTLSNAFAIGVRGDEGLDTDRLDNAYASILHYALAYVALGALAGVSTFGSGALLATVGERMTMRLRLAVFKNILRQDGTFFDNPLHASGKLAARLATDAPNVQAAIDQRLAEVLQGVVSLAAGVSIAFYFGWNVAPICLITALGLVVAQSSVSGYLKRRGMRDLALAAEASHLASESLAYVRTVQALNQQGAICARFRDASRAPHRAALVRGLWYALSFAMGMAFCPCNFAISYLFGLFLIRGGHTTPYTVFQVIEALNMASITIMAASAYFPEYLKARLAAGLMFSMVSKVPRIDSASEDGVKKPIDGAIAFNSVYFSYPNARRQAVLRGLSLHAPRGRTIALVGPSGCGKSTVLSLLERLYDVLGGYITLDELDVRHFNVAHLRRAIAIVGQEPTLFNLSIRDNILYGMMGANNTGEGGGAATGAEGASSKEVLEWRMVDAAKLANIHSFIQALPLGYDTLVGERGGQLSGGQKQRIAIARAVVRDPRILLLDEATSALDAESEQLVQEALDRAKEGRTCVVVAHRLSTVQHADVIVVIREGRVAEMGNHAQLMERRGVYYRLVQRQAVLM